MSTRVSSYKNNFLNRVQTYKQRVETYKNVLQRIQTHTKRIKHVHPICVLRTCLLRNPGSRGPDFLRFFETLDGSGLKTRFSGRFRLKNVFFWTVPAQKRVFLDGSGSKTRFSGRLRLKNAFFWTVPAQKRT